MALRLGTRSSALAQWQANWVATHLRQLGHKVELVLISTQGDATQSPSSVTGGVASVESLGSVGVFTKELQKALVDSRIDLAVHSLKDLPTDPVAGIALAAVPKRESVFDVLISREGLPLEQLPEGAVIGTGSLRRRSQLLHLRPDLQVRDIRGNVDTRLKKLREGHYDAIVLAEAGLNRLGFDSQITQRLTVEQMLPAVGQGALGIETRNGDDKSLDALRPIDDPATHAAVISERTLLASLRGGCLAPIGAWARITSENMLQLSATVLSPDGKQRLISEAVHDEPISLGDVVAQQLIAQGAASLIDRSRK